MRFKPRFSVALLLLLCSAAACAIAGVVWLRTNTIIRSGVSGTLVGRDGERYPTNRWFHLRVFDPLVFYDDSVPLGSAGNDTALIDGMRRFSVLETKQGTFRANVDLWRYVDLRQMTFE